MWLGGLLNPEAYITATRQCVAQANSWSLEELYLEVTITDSNDQASIPHDCFAVTGKKKIREQKRIDFDVFFLQGLNYKELSVATTSCYSLQVL